MTFRIDFAMNIDYYCVYTLEQHLNSGHWVVTVVTVSPGNVEVLRGYVTLVY